MNTLLARTILVVGAFVLVGTGVFAALPGTVRLVAVAAGSVLAVLDRLVVAAGRSRASQPAVEWRQRRSETAASQLDPPAPQPAPARTHSPVPDPDRPATLVVGHRLDDGSPVHTAASHLVVVGRGALARAVFDALSAQLGAATVAAPSRHSEGLPDGLAPLPEGIVVHVVSPDGRHGLRTLVLVPDHGRTPRRADAVVTVGRSGCTFRTAQGEPIATAPVLPILDLPAEGAGALPAEGAGAVDAGTASAESAGPRPAEPTGTAPGLSADRRRRGRRPPGRPHRAPARPSPP
ncbi:hypothetical protein JOE58_001053 [Curtobacterium luteum]|uniref:Uncharacterized protein n=1 Tax=Curtobacterium luteum TaxID=33881 RepID=A0ABS2RTL8_9MICO|nr:hypothetical protein [Curtobacterium luteum]MBM7801802.1 hypothetical protein [Curtobacterium luteum]NUU51879.1 hypothetical protein [Curtobacterium luteum]